MTRYCEKCGCELEPDALFCTNCGEKIVEKIKEEPEKISSTSNNTSQRIEDVNHFDSSTTLNEIKDDFNRYAKDFSKNATEVGGKALELAKGLASNAYDKGVKNAEKRIEAASSRDVVIEKPEGTQEIWSNLKNNSKRNHYFTENVLEMSEEEYMEFLALKIKDNMVPAKIVRKKVWWDRKNIDDNRFFVEPITSSNNPYTCLLSFDKIGKFTFIERTTFITPPDLPKEPGKIVPILEKESRAFYIGLGIAALGFLAMFNEAVKFGINAMVIGAVVAFVGYSKNSEIRTLKAHNLKVQKEIEDWNNAWDTWEKTYLSYAYEENVVGELGRIFDSIYDCINQVSEEKIKGTVLSKESQAMSLNDMQDMLQKRKKGYQ